MYHYMHLDPSLIRERNERMRAEMSKLRLEKRLRNNHGGSGSRLGAFAVRLKGILSPPHRAGTAARELLHRQIHLDEGGGD